MANPDRTLPLSPGRCWPGWLRFPMLRTSALLLLILSSSHSLAQEVSIGVFGLFHPRRLEAHAENLITIRADDRRFSAREMTFALSANGIRLKAGNRELMVTSVSLDSESFTLTV